MLQQELQRTWVPGQIPFRVNMCAFNKTNFSRVVVRASPPHTPPAHHQESQITSVCGLISPSGPVHSDTARASWLYLPSMLSPPLAE